MISTYQNTGNNYSLLPYKKEILDSPTTVEIHLKVNITTYTK